jgi:titin
LPNGQALSSFVVRTVLASDGTTLAIPDTIVGPGQNGIVPTSALIGGLPLGTAVQFLVAASNTFGTSQFSIASAAFTPFAPTPPTAPTGVVATAGNASAQVAWSAPSSNGGLPITSYTVTAQLNGTTAVANVTVPANQTGVNFTGLTNGSTYNFVVFATNAAGNSAASLPSNAVIPTVPDVQDIAVTMSAPSSLNAGSFDTFTITVTNNGPGDAPNVTLADTMGRPFVSATTTRGACSAAGSSFTCTLGGMPAGSNAIVKLTMAMGSTALTNSATATLRDLLGNVKNTDPNLANNTASATTNISSGSNNVTADIQVTGSSNNGGPAVGSNVTFTWQVKNNTGSATAPNVSFETVLPSTFQLVSANTSTGSCTLPPPGLGGSLSCLTSSLPGGQTMIVTYVVTVTQAGSFTTTGNASSGANDSQPSNNSFSVTIQPK